jgi:YD repeat-containing protein
MVEQITAAARKSGIVAADSVIAYQTMLRESASIRSSEWRRFVKRGAIVPPAVAVGTTLRALTPYGVDDLTRTPSGYERAIADGSRQLFDDQGRMTGQIDAAGHRIDLARTPRGRLLRIRDDLGRTLRVTTDTGGRVLRVDADSGRYAAYRYDKRGDLVWTRDTDGIVITHAYDSWHYLTRIGNTDGKDVLIAYYPVSMNARVRRVTDEAGRTAAYTYRWTRADSLEYIVDIAVLARARAGSAVRDTISRRQHVYEERRKSNGERWMYRIAETVDGRTESTVYDEECGMPLQLVRGSDTTTRTLDGRCRVSTRTTAARADSLGYDSKDRIAFLSSLPRGGGARIETQYAYDSTGQVSGVTITSGNEVMVLAYDSAGQLRRVTDTDGELTIARDGSGRPTTLSHSKFGGATIAYAADGAPTVTPTAGADIAAFRAFRGRLVALSAPAGLTVDF